MTEHEFSIRSAIGVAGFFLGIVAGLVMAITLEPKATFHQGPCTVRDAKVECPWATAGAPVILFGVQAAANPK